MKSKRRYIFLLYSLLVLSACGGGGSAPPATTVSPPSGTTIRDDASITVNFNAAMDSGSLVASGTLASQANLIWNADYTQLSISPTTGNWVEGQDQTLTVNISNNNGSVLDTLSLSYHIDGSVPVTTASLISQTLNYFPSVTLSCDDGVGAGCDATYYTLNTDPLAQFDVYNGPIEITTPGVTTLRFYSQDTLGYRDVLRSETYTIDVQMPITTASLTSGRYNSAKTAVLTCNDHRGTGCTGTFYALTQDRFAFNLNYQPYLKGISVSQEGTNYLWMYSIDAAGNKAAPSKVTLTLDFTPPNMLTAVPVTSSTISTTEQIVVGFSESMAPESLALSGTLTDGGVASTWLNSNRQLVIDPVAGWPGGDRSIYVSSTDAAGNALPPLQLNYTVDVFAPSLVNGTFSGPLRRNQEIFMEFSETMDPASLALSGDLAGLATVEWLDGDTLLRLLPPVQGWPIGQARTLGLDVNDSFGNPFYRTSRVFDINVIFVSVNDPNAADSGQGSRETPKQTIQSGIAKALTLPLPAEVHVAEGTYSINSGVNDLIFLENDLSLYGGYARDWSERSRDLHQTAIRDTATEYRGGSYTNTVIESNNESIDASTVVDGFYVYPSQTLSGQHSVGGGRAMQIIRGTPVLSNNYVMSDYSGVLVVLDSAAELKDSTIVSAEKYWEVLATNCNIGASIHHNKIEGGVKCFGGGESSTVYPIIYSNVINSSIDAVSVLRPYNVSDFNSPVIYNNILISNSGIRITGATSPLILNNIIISRYAGVDVRLSAQATLVNNIIDAHDMDGSLSVCVKESNPERDGFDEHTGVVDLRNNNLFGCDVLFNNAECSNPPACTSVSQHVVAYDYPELLNFYHYTTNSADRPASGNVSIPVNFLSEQNYHLLNPDPMVSFGGVDASNEGWGYNTDFDGVMRTVPWSIGAYEYD